MSLGTLYSSDTLCPFTHRVLIAAAELAAPIDVVYADDIPAAVREANTGGNWPVFAPAGGSSPLEDSSEIVEHLIAASGERGEAYRCDPALVATLDTLAGCISRVIRAGEPAMQREFRGKLDETLAASESALLASGGPYLGGERFSQADGHIAPFLFRLPFLVEVRGHVPAILRESEALNAWIDRLVRHPSFAAIAPKRHLVRQFYADKAKYGKPMKVGRLHHSGFRGMWNDLTARVSAIAAGEDEGNERLREARALCYLLFRMVALHAKFENLLLFPALDAARDDARFTAEGAEQHAHEEGEMNSLLASFDRALELEPGKRGEALADLAAACEQLKAGQFAHFEYEEANFMPVLSGLDLDQHLSMLRGAYEMCILERPHLIGVLTSYMPVENVLSLLDSLLHAVEPASEQWRTLLREVHDHLAPEAWLRVVRRFEDVLPVSLMVAPAGLRRGALTAAARALQQAAPVERIEIPRG